MVKGRQWGRLSWGIALELLEQPHMEHIMNARPGWQGEANSHLVDHLRDTVGPEETRLELATAR
jgi:hypothetical protein